MAKTPEITDEELKQRALSLLFTGDDIEVYNNLVDKPFGQLAIDAILSANPNAFPGIASAQRDNYFAELEAEEKKRTLSLMLDLIEIADEAYKLAQAATNQAVAQLAQDAEKLSEEINATNATLNSLSDLTSGNAALEADKAEVKKYGKLYTEKQEKLSELEEQLPGTTGEKREEILQQVNEIKDQLIDHAETYRDILQTFRTNLHEQIDLSALSPAQQEGLEKLDAHIKNINSIIETLKNDSLTVAQKAEAERQLRQILEQDQRSLEETLKNSEDMPKAIKKEIESLSAHVKTLVAEMDQKIYSIAEKHKDKSGDDMDRQDFLGEYHKVSSDRSDHHWQNVKIETSILTGGLDSYLNDHKKDYVTTRSGNIVFMNEQTGQYYVYPDNNPDAQPHLVPANELYNIKKQAWNTDDPKYLGSDTALNNRFEGHIKNTLDNLRGGRELNKELTNYESYADEIDGQVSTATATPNTGADFNQAANIPAEPDTPTTTPYQPASYDRRNNR